MNQNLLRYAGLAAVLGSAAQAQTHVTANITADTQWTTAGSPYVLQGVIYVTGGVTLDIAPGVIVRGQPKSTPTATDPGALIITRGSKIQARGTASSPIIFTTAALDNGLMAGGPATGLRYDGNLDSIPDRWIPADGNAKWLDLDPANTPLAPNNSAGQRNSSLWGSLVLLGAAEINAAVDLIPFDTVKDEGRAYLEGLNTSALNEYGGENDDDSSGFLNYVSLRHGGYEITSGKELNGITLAGVGRGTTVRNVEIYCNSDDGIEIFGGTVDVSYAAISFCEDDGLDLDQGHRGTIQFVYVAHGITVGGTTPLSSDPRGMELDGDDANESGAPITATGQPFQNSRIFNATVQVTAGTTPVIEGVRMRRGFRGELVNSIVTSSSNSGTGINIDSTAAVGVSPFVRQSYADRLLNVRNTTVNGFTTATSSFSATPALAGVPNVGVSTTFTPSTNAGTTGFSGVMAAIFPNTVNNVANPDMLSVTYAANGLNPRPGAGAGSPSGLATGGTQDSAYVKFPAVFTTYKGAFNPSATTLWTTGWTALNKTNTEGVKPLVN